MNRYANLLQVNQSNKETKMDEFAVFNIFVVAQGGIDAVFESYEDNE